MMIVCAVYMRPGKAKKKHFIMIERNQTMVQDVIREFRVE